MIDKDFRVGDKATRIIIEKGIINGVYTEDNHSGLNYKNSAKVFYYHGHEVTFTAKGEESPKRTVTQYVNLYLQDGNVCSSRKHETKLSAEIASKDDAIAIGIPIGISEEEV